MAAMSMTTREQAFRYYGEMLTKSSSLEAKKLAIEKMEEMLGGKKVKAA